MNNIYKICNTNKDINKYYIYYNNNNIKLIIFYIVLHFIIHID